jgi:p-methyltransferase
VTSLDCVVIGYNEIDFDTYRKMCQRAGDTSPEMQIFRKEHVRLGDRHLPWLSAFSELRNRAHADQSGRRDLYHPGEVYNLACLYLTSFLRRAGLRTESVSLFEQEIDRVKQLLAERPLVVAITTTFYVNVMPVLPIVEVVRAISPDSTIVIGGPLVDNLTLDLPWSPGAVDSGLSDVLDLLEADIYVRESQGEATLRQVVETVKAGGQVSAIANLILRDGADWVTTGRVPEANSLDQHAIDWNLFPAADLGPVVQLRTARSCAFKCSFCDYPSRAGALTLADVETVRHELRTLASKGVETVIFVDDTFNVPPKRFKALCEMMISEDLGLDWYSYFRCSNARDDETFDLALRSGCRGVFLGIESGDPAVLKNMRKLAQDDQYRVGIERLNERGITTFASIIVGFPGESAESVARTTDFINETRPTFWRAQAWWANPRSAIFQQQDELGITGSAYTWSHNTMNSEQAAAYCDQMFDDVTESTWLPLYGFDFWSLPYLVSKGVDAGQLKRLLDLTAAHMSARDGGRPAAADAALGDLESAVAALTMKPSRFSAA